MTDSGTYRAARRILDIAASDPTRPALIIDDETWSYGELVAAASRLASARMVVFIWPGISEIV